MLMTTEFNGKGIKEELFLSFESIIISWIVGQFVRWENVNWILKDDENGIGDTTIASIGQFLVRVGNASI